MDHVEDPLEEYAKIRMGLENDILHGKSPSPDGRHAQLRLGFAEKYKHIPLEKLIKENAKGLNWGTTFISAFESLYALGDDLLRLSTKREDLQSPSVALDQELQDICGTADILRDLGYRIIGDTSAILPKWYQVKRENTSAVLAELRLAKDDMIIFLRGKHVLHDEICQLIPTDYCPPKKCRSRRESAVEKTQTGIAETSPCETRKVDKADICQMASSQPENLTAEESRCPHCDFINLADASLCISCAEPLSDTKLFISRAETPKDTNLFISQSELQIDTSVSRAEPQTITSVSRAELQTITSASRTELQTITSISRAEPQTITSVSRAQPQTFTIVSRAQSQTITSVSPAEHQTITSVSHAEPKTISSVSRAEQQTISSVSRAEPQTFTIDSRAQPQTITSVSHAEPKTITTVSCPQTISSGYRAELQTSTRELPEKMESDVGTKDGITCPHCTFFNPRTCKICSMCSKTINSSPIQSPSAGYLDSERHQNLQHRTVIKLIGDSDASVIEQKAVPEEKQSTEEKHNEPTDLQGIKATGALAPLVDHIPPHKEEAQQSDKGNESPGCPRCTFQNPLPTNYCKMCNTRLTTEVAKGAAGSTKGLAEAGEPDVNGQPHQPMHTANENRDTKEIMSPHRASAEHEPNDSIGCPVCKGALRKAFNAENRTCIHCHLSFCEECRQPVTEHCPKTSCFWKCHCYHRRSCAYWLRQQYETTLERFLKENNCPYKRYIEWYRCQQGYQFHLDYQGYLIKVIQDEKIDPADGMTEYELRELINAAMGVDVAVRGTTRKGLIEFVKKNIP